MKIVKQWWMFEEKVNGLEILKKIERAGRVCYKTEDAITDVSAGPRIRKWVESGHHSVIEHHNITVRIVTDRGVTHEIVRHRLASYSQESTRYCNYGQGKFGKEITVVLPVWFYDQEEEIQKILDEMTRFKYAPDLSDPEKMKVFAWTTAMIGAEASYMSLLSFGQTAQEARAVLPNSLKTELVMTANIREWRHFFKLRTSVAAHPQMRELAKSMLLGFQDVVPVLFDEL
jgi:thymidylate synthase (FAD)